VPQTVLVTGASGFAGSHLLDLLATTDARLIAWSHRGGHHKPQDAPGVWHAVDVLDAGGVDRAVAETSPDLVYHLAGDAQSGGSWDRLGATFAVNVRGTHHLLAAVARHVPSARVVVAGSALVYKAEGHPIGEDSELKPASPYAVSKLAQETLALRAARLDRLDIVVARPFNHVGPRQSPAFIAASVARQLAMVEAGRAEPQLRVGNLDAERDLTDVRDTVRAYQAMAAKGRSGTAYNVCSGEGVRMKTLVQALVDRTRVPVEVVIDPSRFRPVDVPRLVGANTRLQTDTGWSPTIPLDLTLDDLLEYWRGRVRAGSA
jgi:GDP-4-dehydro-6-deoxy-D-mannose reductase